MVAPCGGSGGKRKRTQLAIGSATIALLLLFYHLLYPASQDLTDVFYPSPSNRYGLHDSRTSRDETSPSTKNERHWIHAPPLPSLSPDGTIFLLETSGRSDINPREWCAIESAARAHPHYIVLFLVAAPRIKRSSLAASVMALNNTRLARLRFAELLEGTVLEEWYKSRVVLRSWWQASHMSDALRFALLMKFGGIYLDTDVIVRRSMAEMDDGAGLESEHSIAAGVLKFSRRSMVPRLLAAWFVDHYDPHDWGGNGPGVVTAVLLRGCGLGELPLPASHCGEYTIFGSRRFYGVPWPNWRLLLEPSQRDVVLERVDAAYVVHTWGLHISGHPAPVGSAMYQLAEQHCPLALGHAGQRF